MNEIQPTSEGSKNAEIRRGRPKKVVRKTGLGRTLSPEELSREQAAFTTIWDQSAKMVARVEQLTAPKSRLRRFMLAIVSNKFMGCGWDPNKPDYLQFHTPQKKMAALLGCSVPTVKRMVREAVQAGLLERPAKDVYVSHGPGRISRLRTYTVTIGEFSDPTKLGAESPGNSEVSEFSDPTIPKTLVDKPPSAKPERQSRRKSTKKKRHPAPRVSTHKRYGIAHKRAQQRIEKDARIGNRGQRLAGWFERWLSERLGQLDALSQPIDYRGREVWIYEVAVRSPEIYEEQLKVREDKLLSGSKLNRGAFLKAAKETRELEAEERSAKANKERVEQFEHISDSLFAAPAPAVEVETPAPAAPESGFMSVPKVWMTDEEIAQKKREMRLRLLKEYGYRSPYL